MNNGYSNKWFFFSCLLLAMVWFQPAYASFGLNNEIRHFVASPGQHIEGGIRLYSSSDSDLTVSIRDADLYLMSDKLDDFSVVEEEGLEKRSMRDWLDYATDRATLAPQDDYNLRYTIDVPDDPNLYGSYWAVLLFQQDKTDLDAQIPPDEHLGIQIEIRYAVLLVVTIAGSEDGELTFEGLEIKEERGVLTVFPTIYNPGDTMISAQFTVQVLNQKGEPVGDKVEFGNKILPHSRKLLKAELRGIELAPGEYLLSVYADYGAPAIKAAQTRFSIDKDYYVPLQDEPENQDEAAGQ